MPWSHPGDKGEATLAGGPPLGPHLGETSETELFSSLALFFFSMFVEGGSFN